MEEESQFVSWQLLWCSWPFSRWGNSTEKTILIWQGNCEEEKEEKEEEKVEDKEEEEMKEEKGEEEKLY